MGYQLYFWDPSTSPHKASLYRALRAHPRVDALHLISQNELPADRLSLGWTAPTDMCVDTVAPSREQVATIITGSAPDAIHVFSGLHWVPSIVEGLRVAAQYGRRHGVMSEPRDSAGLSGMLRKLHSWVSEGSVRASAEFILAIGRHGPTWFKSVGYAETKLFPFAYFIDEVRAAERLPEGTLTGNRMGFVGRFEESKGAGLLVQLLELLDGEWTFTFVGDGSMRPLIEEAAVRDNRVRCLGVLPMDRIQDTLREIDILFAPSIVKDGWGVVVSEALLSGAAVICSDVIGASICVDNNNCGVVLANPSIGSLAEAVRILRRSVNMTATGRNQRSAWAREHLSGRAGAEYLISVLDHVYEGGLRPHPFYDSQVA